jgi:hypothetical protein
MDSTSPVPEDDMDESSSSSSDEVGHISSFEVTSIELQMLEAHSQATSKSKGTYSPCIYFN